MNAGENSPEVAGASKPTRKASGKATGRSGRKPVRQRHGGALIPGAGGGAHPGQQPGRPTNELRAKLTNVLEKGVPVLQQIASGEVVNKRRFRVGELLPHVNVDCPNCGEQGLKERLQLMLADPEYGQFATIEGMESATAKERIAALALAGDFGPGKVKQVSTDMVREKVRETLRILRDAIPPELLVDVLPLLRELWTGEKTSVAA